MNKMQFKTVGLGEVLYDVLPSGEKLLGGAPANFAYISAQLGNKSYLASRVGNDADGRRVLEKLKTDGIDISFAQIDEVRETGRVKVSFQNGQPAYRINENSAWDFLSLTEEWKSLAENCDAVCFGSLAQRNPVSKKTINEFIKLTKPDCLRVFDINLRQNFYTKNTLSESLEAADILKLNDEELPKVVGLFSIKGENDLQLIENLRKQFDLSAICLTRGAKGSLLVSEEEISDHPGVKTEVVNTIGAGDAFTATLVHGLLKNWNLDKINKNANTVGAFVASKSGAMPDFKEFDLTNFTE